MNKSIQLKAQSEKLEELLAEVEEWLGEVSCPPAKITTALICTEEIFVNIVSYAYGTEGGDGWVACEASTGKMKLCFMDQGAPYNPLKREDPDITLPADERQVGGLGIYMVKQMMDDVYYVYRDGKNCLTLEMNWQEKNNS